jgi:cytochrome P450
MRTASEDVTIGGYTIPAGWVISADPRISNNSPDIFPRPEKFIPERFMGGGCPFGFGSGSGDQATNDAMKAQFELSKGGNSKFPDGAWFPGGIGSHKCPGVPLAMLTAKVM